MQRSPWPILTSLTIAIILTVGPLMLVAGQARVQAVALHDPGWRLVFSDEFNSGVLDTGTWKTAFPWGRDRRSVGELQRYIPEAVTVSQGNLLITAQLASRERYDYTSGIIASHASFAREFGRFEMRARLPSGQGLWPAFWLLPETETWPPEIDVFEALGHEPDTVYMTTHWREGDLHRQRKGAFTGPDFSANYHVFALEWTRNKLVWSIDGVKRHEVRGKSPQGPMYLLANLAVGGAWPGAPDATTPFPAVFAIDYIRVYERVTGDG